MEQHGHEKVLTTPWKFNSSPLKNGGTGRLSLSYWVSVSFQGLCHVKVGEGNNCTVVGLEVWASIWKHVEHLKSLLKEDHPSYIRKWFITMVS